MERESENEIWSEYFRIKNRLIDYDENLRDAVSACRMLQKLGYDSRRYRFHLAKAQKHVALILDLGLACGAIPPDAEEKETKFVEAVAMGAWVGIEDFERCQKHFRAWYIKTKFYNITLTHDTRPGVLHKYGRPRP